MGATEDRRCESGVPLFRRSDRTCVGLPATGHVMSAWPPPADASTVWHELPVMDADPDPETGSPTTLTRLRVVRLWGSDVLIDEQARVVCRMCLRLLTVEELADDLFRSGMPEHVLGMPWRLPAVQR